MQPASGNGSSAPSNVGADRAAQYEQILQKLAERGDHGSIEQAERNRIAFDTSDALALGADPASAFIGHCAHNLLDALRRMGIDEQILELVCIGSTLQDDVSAEMRRLRDGSGLILVSDSILTLGGLLSNFVGELFIAWEAGRDSLRPGAASRWL